MPSNFHHLHVAGLPALRACISASQGLTSCRDYYTYSPARAHVSNPYFCTAPGVRFNFKHNGMAKAAANEMIKNEKVYFGRTRIVVGLIEEERSLIQRTRSLLACASSFFNGRADIRDRVYSDSEKVSQAPPLASCTRGQSAKGMAAWLVSGWRTLPNHVRLTDRSLGCRAGLPCGARGMQF